jgi:hypothetical protein
VYGSFNAFGHWIEATDVGRWANQSSEEIAHRMRQVIYERMVKNGKWADNAGCC